jgi:hypothetical protein
MKRHSLDVLSLVFGLIFLLVAGSWIIRRNTNVDLPEAGWFIAGALIIAGLFGIVSSLRGSQSKEPKEEPAAFTSASGYEAPEYVQTDTTASLPPYKTDDESKPEDRGF